MRTETAFAAAISINAAIAFRRMPRSLKNQLACEDLQQQGWEIALRAREKYDAARGCSFRSFLGKKVAWGLKEFLRAYGHIRWNKRNVRFIALGERDFSKAHPEPLEFLNVSRLLSVLDAWERRLIIEIYWNQKKQCELRNEFAMTSERLCVLHRGALAKLHKMILAAEAGNA